MPFDGLNYFGGPQSREAETNGRRGSRVLRALSSILFTDSATMWMLIPLLCAVFLSGCGESTNSSTLAPGAVASVTVSPATITIIAGQRQQFTAVAKDSNGNVISGVIFTWSSDATSVATVDSNGLATGMSQGTAHISALASGVTGSGTLTVNPRPSGNAIPASFYGFTINKPCSISDTKPDGTSCNNPESHSFPGLPFTWARSLTADYIKWNDVVQCDPSGTAC